MKSEADTGSYIDESIDLVSCFVTLLHKSTDVTIPYSIAA